MLTRRVAIVRSGDELGTAQLQYRVLILCSLASFIDGYDVQALGIAVPAMAADFGVAPTAFAGALSGSLAGMAAGAMFLGSLGDRYGRRPMLIALMLLVALTTLPIPWCHSQLEIALLRVMTGLGIGGALPIAIAMGTEFAPARHRTALVTLMVSCTALGSFAAGILAPSIEHRWGWRGIFFIGSIFPFGAAGVLWLALPESLALLVQRKIGGNPAARPAPSVVPPLEDFSDSAIEARGALVKRLFTPRLRSRTLFLWTIFWANLFVNYSLISWLPTLLTGAGWAHAAASRATGILALGGVVGGVFLAWLADRGWAIRALALTYVIVALVLASFVIESDAPVRWTLLIALVGSGAFGAQMALGSYCAEFYPPSIRSTGLGWAGGIGRVGAILGPLALAVLINQHIASATILGLFALPMLLCAACVFLLDRAAPPLVEESPLRPSHG